MVALLLLLALVGITIYTLTYINRKKTGEEPEIVINENAECCGAHEVCDQENLQIIDTKIDYFDDEEFDELAGIALAHFSQKQNDALSDIFYSLKENDVAAWLRSLQLRDIQLPENIREEALMIVGERRGL